MGRSDREEELGRIASNSKPILPALSLGHGALEGAWIDRAALLCTQLKLKERNVPFIVYSGYNKVEGACAAGELVQKPASPEMLVATLTGLLTEHRRGIN